MVMDSFFLTTVGATIYVIFFTLFRKFRIRQEKKDVGSSSVSPDPSAALSSSPSSSTSTPYTHLVFPSFHEGDVGRKFLSHLKKEFRRMGISAFSDEGIPRGESIAPELIKAIRASKIAIVIFSENFASSTRCLEELVEIMNRKPELGFTVFAIFYEVDPSDVKELTGDFGAVFKETFEDRSEVDIQKWKQAFDELSEVAGYVSKSDQWENDAEMIEEIVTKISRMLIKVAPSRDLEGLIGMEAHTEKMKELLCLNSADEKSIVGIIGPQGSGKSTIARVLYNQISDGFELSVFMKFKPIDARTLDSDDYDLKLELEQQFLDQLRNPRDMDIKIPRVGASRTFVDGKKVLIVLDGVDELVQFQAMPVACLGLGSCIIITTRHQYLLDALKINHIYNVEFPTANEGLKILCMNAFGQDSPPDGYEDLALELTRLARRYNRLELRDLGSQFLGMSEQDWQLELLNLRVSLDGQT